MEKSGGIQRRNADCSAKYGGAAAAEVRTTGEISNVVCMVNTFASLGTI